MSNFVLVLYSIAWLITFWYSFRKKKVMDAGNIIILLFFLYSIASILLYNDSGRGDYFFGGKEITIFPLLYLYAMIMLTMSPVFSFNQSKVVDIERPNPAIVDTISFIFIIASILKIPADIHLLSSGMVTILTDAEGGLDVYSELMESSASNLGDGIVSSLPSIITNLLRDVAILIFWYYIVIGKKRTYIILLGVFILSTAFISLARAQRGPALSVLLMLLVSYGLFIKFIPEQLKKKLTIAFIVVAVAIFIPFMAISHSRFDRSDGGVQSSFLYYTGQENLNFDIYAFDNNGLRYGDRVFPFFKRMLGYSNVPHNFWERRAKYPNLKINDEVFVGYVGDFVMDFGPIVTVLIFIFFTSIFYSITRIRGKTVYFYQLLTLSFLSKIGAVGGMKLFPYADDGAYGIIVFIILYVIFYLGAAKKYNALKIR